MNSHFVGVTKLASGELKYNYNWFSSWRF